MKKALIYIFIALFGVTALGATPARETVVLAQKKDKGKKDPPGPPVVRDKNTGDKKGGKEGERPRKGDKKPPEF